MAPKTNTVQVCGRRTNTGNPQSWWVDTGIYVTTANQLSIDSTQATGTIKPWHGHPGFTPAGDVGNVANRDWAYALANITGVNGGNVSCWFGSLIGKIGRDGKAFPIGQAKTTFTPSTSGTLFLAFNDGQNFEDNTGTWTVTVTFEQFVQLAPVTFGTEQIVADLIRGSFLDDWGVILTVEQGTPNSVYWDKPATDNLVSAFNNIQSRLAQTGFTFKNVYAGLELRLAGFSGAGQTTFGNGHVVRFGIDTQGYVTRKNDRSWGRVNPIPQFKYYPSTTGYGFFNAGDQGIQNTIMHELGHIIAYRTNNTSNSMFLYADPTHFNLMPMPDVAWLPPRTTDSTVDRGSFWENLINVTAANEIMADNYLNWVRNSYIGVENNIDTYPTTGTLEQKRASAYWKGGIPFTNPSTQSTITSPGIKAFAQQAAQYVNATVLLRSLGLGETDPNCTF